MKIHYQNQQFYELQLQECPSNIQQNVTNTKTLQELSKALHTVNLDKIKLTDPPAWMDDNKLQIPLVNI